MTELPTGTVTFLYTDIQGSTPLWERIPQAMQAALARHNDILEKAILDHGGRVFKFVGDAYSAAFPLADQAVEAAIAAQRALQTETWGETGPLKVRMGIHTASGEVRGGDYVVSHDLNRVARIMSAAHGGQILLSEAAAELTRQHLPSGFRLRDLGEHRLKGMAKTEHLYQVLFPDLPNEFPVLDSESTARHNLPTPSTLLVGREQEADELGELLRRDDIRLITLTGPGGTGKTRLALEAAHRALPHYRDGVFFVSLAPLNDPQLMLVAIARELDVKESGGPVLDRLKVALAGRELLLVLDNFEHLLAAAPIVSEILAAAPRLKVLATSRERLHLDGERLYPVKPLAAPPAVQLNAGLAPEEASEFAAVELFCKRAVAVWPTFELTTANAASVGEICNRLDGLPLAIELAAARLPLFGTPEVLVSRMGSSQAGSRLKLLRGGSRDRPARQKTLEAAIDWSYRLLSAEEQKLFRRLAVFSGGFTLETAEAVANRDGDLSLDVLDGLEALFNKSLLRQEGFAIEQGRPPGEPRFGMLQTIQDFARERLEESGEMEQMRLNHTAAFLALAETAEPHLSGPEQGRWLDRLEGEHNNLRAALDWSRRVNRRELSMRIAAALAWFWHTHGHYSEGRQNLDAVLPGPWEEPNPKLYARALHGAGILAFAQGDYEKARNRFEEGLKNAQQEGYRKGEMNALRGLGDVASYHGDDTAARAYYQLSLEIAEALEDRNGIVLALSGLGGTAADHGDYSASRGYFERSLEAARETGDSRQIARALNGLGYVAADQGDPRLAWSYFERSLEIAEEIGDRGRTASTLGNLGAVAADLSDFEAARSYYERSLVIADEIGDPSMAALALVNLSEIELIQGSYSAANAYNERGRSIAAETGEKRIAAISSYIRGEIERRRGDYSSARSSLVGGLEMAELSGDRRTVAITLTGLGAVALSLSEDAAARSYYEHSLAIAAEIGEKRVTALALNGLGVSALRQGEDTAARASIERSLRIAEEIDDKRQIALALSSLADLEVEQNQPTAARSSLERSLTIASQVGDKETTAEALRKLAALETDGDSAARAARLWGAAERLLEEIGAVIPPIERSGFDNRMARLRELLGEEGFAALMDEGRALSIGEVLDYVRLQFTTGE